MGNAGPGVSAPALAWGRGVLVVGFGVSTGGEVPSRGLGIPAHPSSPARPFTCLEAMFGVALTLAAVRAVGSGPGSSRTGGTGCPSVVLVDAASASVS